MQLSSLLKVKSRSTLLEFLATCRDSRRPTIYSGAVSNQADSRTVVVSCPAGHSLLTPARKAFIAHTERTLVGLGVHCQQCNHQVVVELPAASVAMLLEFGVELAQRPLSADWEPLLVGEHRAELGRRFLLPQESSSGILT